jgi:hypothetical protein
VQPYWWGHANREQCATALKQSGHYLFRVCGDPGERIDGQPNPNLFVLSYMEGSDIKNMKVFRFPDGLGQDRGRNCTIHRTVDSLMHVVLGPSAAPVKVL